MNFFKAAVPFFALSAASAQMMVSGIPGASSPSPAAPAQPAAPQPASDGTPARAPSAGIFESATAERFADRGCDGNSDSVDTDGNLWWKGKTFSVGDSRIVRARFER